MYDGAEFTLTLIRHGESEINAQPDVVGQTAETPLTKRGREQALKLHKRLLKEVVGEGVPYVYSSPYVRALDTCKLAKPFNDEIVLVPELREYDPGDWLFGSRKKIMTPEVKDKMNKLNHMFVPPNGESIAMVERRASKWIEDALMYNKDIIKTSNDLRDHGYNPLHVMCFSHGITIKAILHYIMGFDSSFVWKVNIDNTSITRLFFGEDGWKLLCINDRSHLEV